MYSQMLTDVIGLTFKEKVGKGNTEKALKISMHTKVDHDKEDGYRYLDLVVYGPCNYVGVYIRERWCVIPLEDLEDTDDGDTEVKPGKDYNEGQSEWTKICYHDSGWRSAISDLLFKKRDDIRSFAGNDFYEVIDVPEEIKSL